MKTLKSFCIVGGLLVTAAHSLFAEAASPAGGAPAAYVGDFVSTAASGAAMNDAGDVAGTSYPDPGCGPFCLPVQDTVVWRAGQRVVLPALPGFSGITVRSINNSGWVAGLAGFPNTATRAVVWKPNGNSYTIIDLGVLPGTNSSEAIGIDNLGRVVGWSTTTNFPPQGSPFMWTESGGMVDLSAQGFPDEIPLAISPGGAVASAGFWYQLENPASVVAMPPAPVGFTIGTYPTAINDAGDQARFLVSTGTERPVFLFRFHHEGLWQQISNQGNFTSSIFGVGSINAARDISATILGAAQIAYGPNGTTQPLTPLLSPAYHSSGITRGGPINASGQILAHVLIGNSSRLMKLLPADFCTTNCVRVNRIQMKGRFIQDPRDPGHCSPDNNAFNQVQANIEVTDERGIPLPGFRVSGRFLDDYWTNKRVSKITNAQGRVSFKVNGSCGVGAVAFLVDGVTNGTRTLDKTAGDVAAFVIPH